MNQSFLKEFASVCDWNRVQRIVREVPQELNDRTWRPIKGYYVERAAANCSRRGALTTPGKTEVGYDLLWKRYGLKIESKFVANLFVTRKGKRRRTGQINEVVIKNTLASDANAKTYTPTFDILLLLSDNGIACLTSKTLLPHIKYSAGSGQHIARNIDYSELLWLVEPGAAKTDSTPEGLIATFTAAIDAFQKKIK